MVVVVVVFIELGLWQVRRAESGNTLSYAYAFEWPFLAGYAVYMWWQLVQDELRPERVRSRLVPFASPSNLPAGWARRARVDTEVGVHDEVGSRLGADWRHDDSSSTPSAVSGPDQDGRVTVPASHDETDVDLEMAEYNRYLAALNAQNEPKRW